MSETKKLGSVARIGKKVEAPAPAPKKSKKVAAAVEAVEKPAKVAKPAKERKSEGPRGSRGMQGLTSKLPIAEFQNRLMEKNFKAKLTDAQLAEAMRVEFPDAIPYTEKHVAGIRSGWNTGKRGNQPPVTPLPRFGEDGKPITRGAREKVEKPATAKATSTVAKKSKKSKDADEA